MRSLLEYLLLVALAVLLGLLVMRQVIVAPVAGLLEQTADRISRLGE